MLKMPLSASMQDRGWLAVKQITSKKGGPPLGSRNAWKHGRRRGERIMEASERGAFCKQCWNYLKVLQSTSTPLNGLLYGG